MTHEEFAERIAERLEARADALEHGSRSAGPAAASRGGAGAGGGGGCHPGGGSAARSPGLKPLEGWMFDPGARG